MALAQLTQDRVSSFCLGLVVGVLVITLPGLLSSPPPELSGSVQRSSPATVPATTTGSETAAGVTAGYPGVVVAGSSVDLAMETTGRLALVQVRTGDQVDRDQVIATLETQGLTHRLARERGTLLTAESRWRRRAQEVIEAEQEVQERLARISSHSRREREAQRLQRRLDELLREQGEAEAAVVYQQERVERLEEELLRCELRAPFRGKVADRYLDAGDLADPATPVLRLVGETRLVRFAVPPAEVTQLAPGDELRIRLEEPAVETGGVVSRIAPEIDPASHLVFVEAAMGTPVQGQLVPQPGAVVSVSVSVSVL